MTKFTGFESSTIISGLEMYKTALKKEIADSEAAGNRPFMTQGFVEVQVSELIDKIKLMTKKNKFNNINH
jgi:hypothetical protein